MTRLRVPLLSCLFAVLCVCAIDATSRGQAPVPAETLRTAGDRPIDIRHIRLELAVDLKKKSVEGKAILDVHTLRDLRSFALDAVDFEVRSVSVTDHDAAKPIHFSHDGKKLLIEPEHEWPSGTDRQLIVEYRVRDPKAGLHFFGPSDAEPEVPLTVWSQGESVTNRYWFPCLDQPIQRQTTELIVTVPEGFEVLSNGSLLERRPNDNKTVTFHWSQKQPHVSYLVTMVVGQFDIVNEKWQDLPVSYYVPKGHKDDVARNFGRTRDMIDFFSRRFGVAYPWEKYAQVVAEQFGGGMENTSATTMGEGVLHDERALLDSSPEWIIAHELAHQWWGDMLTCRDWAHLWLNEGFASYCEALWAEQSKGADEYAYNMFQKSKGAIAGGKDRPIVDRRYPSPDSMFDARAYPKGAFVLHMLRQRLGEEAFWKGIQRYGTEHKFQSVETADFRRALEKSTGRSLERFFYDWTERPGHPVLEVTTEYQADTKLARVAVKQTQPAEAFQFPLAVVFSGKDWKAPPVTLTQDVTEKEQTFFVPLPGRPDLVEIDPKQAVLAELTENKGHDLWLEQLRRGSTVISRARAAQQLGKNKSPADREALAKALPMEKYYGVQAEIAGALADSGGDTARDALIAGLKLPEPRARRACADGLGKFHRDAKAAKALKEVLDSGDKSYFVEAAALSSYAKLEQPDTVQVMLPWLAKPSYTDVLSTAALEGLGQSHDLAALDTLTLWAKRGKPRNSRAAALRAMATLLRTANPTDEQRKQAVTVITACLDGEGPTMRRTAVSALRDVGRSGEPAVAALEALARHDPDERLRETAQKAAEAIRTNTPAPVEVTRLRQELERLRKSQEALQERLDKYEKTDRKGS
jgi:aminopeptidase N